MNRSTSSEVSVLSSRADRSITDTVYQFKMRVWYKGCAFAFQAKVCVFESRCPLHLCVRSSEKERPLGEGRWFNSIRRHRFILLSYNSITPRFRRCGDVGPTPTGRAIYVLIA